MKKIIVATDFSTCSIHALEYAISIANPVKADVQLVWVDNSKHHDFDFDLEKPEPRKDVSLNMDRIIEKYQDQLKGELSYKFRKGKVYQEISLLAKAKKADLIVVGTHGVSGFEEYWIGSNAYRIVTHSPCPVITLRQQFPVRNSISKIVIPIDSSSETLQKLDFLKTMVEVFKSEIHMISIYPTLIQALKRKVDANEQKAISFFKENKIKFVEQKVKSDNVTGVLVEYAKKIDADLIAIMTEQGNAKAHVFLGPNAQQLISNSIIPVLNVRPNNEF